MKVRETDSSGRSSRLFAYGMTLGGAVAVQTMRCTGSRMKSKMPKVLNGLRTGRSTMVVVVAGPTQELNYRPGRLQTDRGSSPTNPFTTLFNVYGFRFQNQGFGVKHTINLSPLHFSNQVQLSTFAVPNPPLRLVSGTTVKCAVRKSHLVGESNSGHTRCVIA
ncbi:hypothetical protein BJ508DRAFT_130118 [Ascobolus immersus RN42]|uniref:Uncharacterized protein n=1 Tax=Ascobolus immersus RN42 TaxID=1160509 RepID=A0A3N4I2F4_ASCIM|nr:hypothetical protein BJ508DRAFT_130118 [Ascobolus immersus RN42]